MPQNNTMSSHFMTYTDSELSDEIANCRSAIEGVCDYRMRISSSDRDGGGDDANFISREAERLRQLNIEVMRRRAARPDSLVTASKSPPPKTKVPAQPKAEPLDIDDESRGPPIIIKDQSGNIRTWRPGDGRIHRPGK
jgi:hypothetical protein